MFQPSRWSRIAALIALIGLTSCASPRHTAGAPSTTHDDATAPVSAPSPEAEPTAHDATSIATEAPTVDLEIEAAPTFGPTNPYRQSTCWGGVPLTSEPVVLLLNTGYTVGYSEPRKNPLWAAYTLRADSPRHDAARPTLRFRTDDRVSRSATHDDYTHSGFDRGHLAPSDAIGQWFGPDAQADTFIVTNIIPQKPGLNRQVWQGLEALEATHFTRDFAQVWVFAGPIFTPPRNPAAFAGDVQVPGGCFKIIIEHDHAEPTVLAVVMDQDQAGNNNPLSQYVTTVRHLESLTGLDFFPDLPRAHQDRLETTTAHHARWRTGTTLNPQKIRADFNAGR